LDELAALKVAMLCAAIIAFQVDSNSRNGQVYIE